MEFDPRSKPLRIEQSSGPAIPVEPSAAPKRSGKRCAACGYQLEEGALLCPCGEPVFAENRPAAVPIGGEPRPCPKCGYDLRGSPGVRCPECGIALQGRRAKRDLGRLEGAKSVRWNYAAAGVTLTASLGGCVLISLFGEGGGAELLGQMMLRVGVQLALAIVIFFIVAVMWSGVDDEWPLAVLKVSAAASAAACAGLLISFIPAILFGISTLAFIAVYAAALITLIEMDFSTAFLIAVGTGIMRAVVLSSLFMN